MDVNVDARLPEKNTSMCLIVHLVYLLEDFQVLENVIIDHLRVLETSLISILIGT